ncbi:MAG TPA: sulfatase-like hydrolase/transferase [Holophagaceae bacterium]|nr:sulfatase-like hydrolase/transferase [Holophagaceae bacterium]
MIAPRLRPLLRLFPALLLLLFAGRVTFMLIFAPAGFAGSGFLGRTLWLGLRMDARLVALLLFPALVLLRPGGGDGRPWKAWAAPLSLALNLFLVSALIVVANIDDQAAKPWAIAFLVGAVADWRLFGAWGLGAVGPRRVWFAYALLGLGAVGLSYGVDIAAYSYVHARLSGGLLGLLSNTAMGLRMVWESYPVVRSFLGLGLLIAASVPVFRWAGRATLEAGPVRRWVRVVQGTVVTFVTLFLIWGRTGGYPLRWGDAYSLGNTFAAHAALNPVLFFLETVKDPSDRVDVAEVQATRPLMDAHLGAEPTAVLDSHGLSRVREAHGAWPAGVRPNVVILHLESFAAHKTGRFGNPLDPTPAFDRLCAEGLLFDRFYAPAENTARAMYSVLFGQLDLSPGSRNTATRNPLLVDQYTLVNALDGYAKHYYLGGNGDWAQIRATLKNNIHGLEAHEGDFFGAQAVDVWGVPDDVMLQKTKAHLGTLPEPFFALVQTAGNHPPFTVPAGMGYPRPTPSKEDLAKGGFGNAEEFHSLGLMDWSLGRFFEAARQQPWFARTLWVIYGDHGVPRGPHDARFGEVPMASHHVPLLILAPGTIPPRVVSETVSQVDVMPTVMGLLGRKVDNRTLGRDMLDPAFAGRGAAFTFSPFTTPPVVGLLQGDHYLIIGPGDRPALYDLKDPSGRDLSASDPATTQSMTHLTRATRAWARYLLSHNKP